MATQYICGEDTLGRSQLDHYKVTYQPVLFNQDLPKDFSIGKPSWCDYSRAMVVSCITVGIPVNVWEHIVLEWKDFYHDQKKSPFLPGLVFVLWKKAGVSLDDTYYKVENGMAFNPLLVRWKPCWAHKCEKMDDEWSWTVIAGLKEDKNDDAEPTSA